MICPAPCADCGKIVPLSRLKFVYERGQDRSERGLCGRCWNDHCAAVEREESEDHQDEEWDA